MHRSVWRRGLLCGGTVFVSTTLISTCYLYWSFETGRTVRTARPFVAWLYEGTVNGVTLGAITGLCVAVGVYVLNVRDDAAEAAAAGQRGRAGRAGDARSTPPRFLPRHTGLVSMVILAVILVASVSLAVVAVRGDDEFGNDELVFQFLVGATWATWMAMSAVMYAAAVGVGVLLVRWVVRTRSWTYAARLHAPPSHRGERTETA